MPYSKSSARKSFETKTSDILSAIATAHKKDCPSPDVRKYVLCASIMLCCAKIEEYFEDVINSWADKIENNSIFSADIPIETRSFLWGKADAMVAAYKTYIALGDEIKLINAIGKTFTDPLHKITINDQIAPRIYGDSIYARKKYPSPDNIKTLCNRLGVPKVFNLLNKAAKSTDVENKITSFNDLRTSISHSGIPPGLNDADVKNHIKEMRSFIGTLDRVLYKHIVKATGANTWP